MIKSILDGQTAEKIKAVCDENCKHYGSIRISKTNRGREYICLAAETPLEMKNVGDIERALIGPVYECLFQIPIRINLAKKE